MNQAIVHLEQATQQNAQVVETTGMAAESMQQQAHSLLEMVSRSGAVPA